jgi:hypothetical protein
MAIEYTLGTKTIAGSLVLLNFDRTALSELIIGKDIYGDTALIETYDDLPPFDITLMFQEEIQGRFGDTSLFGSTTQAGKGTIPPSGQPGTGTVQNLLQGNNPVTYSVLEIKGIRLVDEGLVIGTDEAYLETTFQYVAEEIKPLSPVILTTNEIRGFGQILDGDALTNVNGKWFQGEEAFVYADDARAMAAPPLIKTVEQPTTPQGTAAFGFIAKGADASEPLDYSAEFGSPLYGPKVDASTGQYDWHNGGIEQMQYGTIEPHDGTNTCTTTYTVTDSNNNVTEHTFTSLETQVACETTGSTPPPTVLTNLPTNSAWTTGTWTPFLPDHVPWVGVNSKNWPPEPRDLNVIGRVVFPISKEEMKWLHEAGYDSLVHEEIVDLGPRIVFTADESTDALLSGNQQQLLAETMNNMFAGYCEAAFNTTGKIFGACVGDKLGEDSWL